MEQKLVETLVGAGALSLAAAAFFILVFGVVFWIRAVASERIAQAAERKLAAEREADSAKLRREETNTLLLTLTDHVKAGQELTNRVLSILDGTNTANRGTAEALEKQSGLLTLAIAETGDGIRKTNEAIGTVGADVKAITPRAEELAQQVLKGIEDTATRINAETVSQMITHTRTIMTALDGMKAASEEQNRTLTKVSEESHQRLVDAVEGAKKAIENAVIEAYKAAVPPAPPTINMISQGEQPIKVINGSATKLDPPPISEVKSEEPK